MRLKSFKVFNYKCIESSGEITFGQQVALVGKNEAGKTAIISALYKLNPIHKDDRKFPLEDYPRKGLSQYKKRHKQNPDKVVSATFELNEDEMERIKGSFGDETLKSNLVTISKNYDKETQYYNIEYDENSYIKFLLKQYKVKSNWEDKLKNSKDLDELKHEIESSSRYPKEVTNLLEKINSLEKTPVKIIIINMISENLPQFFLFDDYAILPGKISLKELKEFEEGEDDNIENKSGMQTALALIHLAGASIDEFMSPKNYERLKSDLEAASNEITDQLKTYWSQNNNLEIEFDLEQEIKDDQLVDTILHIRVKNTKHRVTVPFDNRSKGFVWFFSFLIAFSDYKDKGDKIILLLDEPGLNLHGKAQKDLLTYFEKELSQNHQLAYTTHSPFLVDISKLENIRTVEDTDDKGTQVSNDPLKGSSDTLFPIQSAMGIDITQTLYIRPEALLVEGPSDLIYITLASQIISNSYKDKENLSDKWTIIPIGGIDKVIPLINVLNANNLKIAIFMDVSEHHDQRVKNILKFRFLKKKNIITIGNILDVQTKVDIEDLFTKSSYLNLINKSYSPELKGKKLCASDIQDCKMPITKKIEKFFQSNNINNGKFNHYKPAYDLNKNPDWQEEIFDKQTIKNFSKAFTEINKILK